MRFFSAQGVGCGFVHKSILQKPFENPKIFSASIFLHQLKIFFSEVRHAKRSIAIDTF
jgi:hypothetical protein